MMLTEMQTDTELDRVQKQIVEKKPATEDIMRSLNKQFTIFANKILALEKKQSVSGRDTGESQGPIGARTLKVLSFGNFAVLVRSL